VLSVLPRVTGSDYPFDIFKLFFFHHIWGLTVRSLVRLTGSIDDLSQTTSSIYQFINWIGHTYKCWHNCHKNLISAETYFLSGSSSMQLMSLWRQHYSFFEGKVHVKTKMHRNSVNPLARLFYAYYFGVDTSAGGLSPMVSSAQVNLPQA